MSHVTSGNSQVPRGTASRRNKSRPASPSANGTSNPSPYLSPLLRPSRVPLHFPKRRLAPLYFPYTCRAFIRYDTVRSRATIKFVPRFLHTPPRSPLVTFAPPLFRSSLYLPQPPPTRTLFSVCFCYSRHSASSPRPPHPLAPATIPLSAPISPLLSPAVPSLSRLFSRAVPRDRHYNHQRRR